MHRDLTNKNKTVDLGRSSSYDLKKALKGSYMENVLRVKIFGKEYQVLCQQGQEQDLLDAANFLDNQMNNIRNGSRVCGVERITVMAALNIAHKYLTQTKSQEQSLENLKYKLLSINEKITVDCPE